VGKLEILSQLKSWKTAFPDAKSEVTNRITVHRARESFDLAGLMAQLGIAQPKH